MFITDEDGKWKVEGNVKILVEPSESYLAQNEIERQALLEQEALDALTPSPEEVLHAEIELKILFTLMEVGLL